MPIQHIHATVTVKGDGHSVVAVAVGDSTAVHLKTIPAAGSVPSPPISAVAVGGSKAMATIPVADSKPSLETGSAEGGTDTGS